MILLELQPRLLESKDWATVIFVVCLMLIVLAKTSFENRFNDFIRLLVSDKYLKIYRDSNHLMSGFNVILFIVNLVSISFLLLLFMDHFGYGKKTDWILFVQIFALVSVFILSKFLIEKIIGVVFNIEETIEQFNLQKVNYRTYIGLLLLPFTIIAFYNDFSTNSLFIWVFGILLIINILTYIFSLKNYQKLIFGKFFYFILYLCTLEIAPYYFIYYMITKK
jgi:hypothetical protein